jgi:hypothetical protein
MSDVEMNEQAVYTVSDQVELEVKQKETIHTFQLLENKNRKEMDDRIVQIIERDGTRIDQTNIKSEKVTSWGMMKEDGFSELVSIVTPIARETTPRWHEAGKFADMEVKELWGIKYTPGDYTNSHSHEPALWSFTYYIDPDPLAPGLSFSSSQDARYSHNNNVIKIKDGLLILFSGSLKHEVKPELSTFTSGHRYVVSGNIYWKSVCWCETLWK